MVNNVTIKNKFGYLRTYTTASLADYIDSVIKPALIGLGYNPGTVDNCFVNDDMCGKYKSSLPVDDEGIVRIEDVYSGRGTKTIHTVCVANTNNNVMWIGADISITRDTVKNLIPHLQRFADTGEL